MNKKTTIAIVSAAVLGVIAGAYGYLVHRRRKNCGNVIAVDYMGYGSRVDERNRKRHQHKAVENEAAVENKPETETEADSVDDKKTKKRGPTITPITAEEFEKDDDYEKIFLSFYSGDGIISDERDEVVENWRSLVGLGVRDMEIYDDILEMYIRNEDRKEDYSISKVEGFYPFADEIRDNDDDDNNED